MLGFLSPTNQTCLATNQQVVAGCEKLLQKVEISSTLVLSTKLVFTQLATTNLICCKIDLDTGSKRRNTAFKLVLKNKLNAFFVARFTVALPRQMVSCFDLQLFTVGHGSTTSGDVGLQEAAVGCLLNMRQQCPMNEQDRRRNPGTVTRKLIDILYQQNNNSYSRFGCLKI